MGRPKIARKSTNIDMTAMCDVAFLLLSFFILTTKFKPAEAITVQTPSSVAAKAAPQKDFVMVTIDKDGKVFFQVEDEQKKELIAETINSTKNLGLNVAAFKKASFFGASFAQLGQFLAIPEEQRKGASLPGIPTRDSSNNEMIEWFRLAKQAYNGQKMDILLKGDNVSKYPAFKSIVTALKKNDLYKFQMVTNPEGVPQGSELYKKGLKGEKREE
jgi:biopolymer transport protein ExbD